MIIEGNVENLVRETNSVRFGFLQILCLEKLYKEEADKKRKLLLQMEKMSSCDTIETSQNKKLFLKN